MIRIWNNLLLILWGDISGSNVFGVDDVDIDTYCYIVIMDGIIKTYFLVGS